MNSYAFRVAFVCGFALLAHSAEPFAGEAYLDNTTIESVSVNGGTDTANPGTSCIKVSNPISPACNGGYVAIPNNNKSLLAAALQAKAGNSNIFLYYFDVGNFHCPGFALTSCSVVTIQLK